MGDEAPKVIRFVGIVVGAIYCTILFGLLYQSFDKQKYTILQSCG